MASRKELVKRYLRRRAHGHIGEMVEMLAHDVAYDSPLTGNVPGRPRVEAILRFRHRLAEQAEESDNSITWSEPSETGDSVKLLGRGEAGAVELGWDFDGQNRIVRIYMNGPSELMLACVLGNDPQIG